MNVCIDLHVVLSCECVFQRRRESDRPRGNEEKISLTVTKENSSSSNNAKSEIKIEYFPLDIFSYITFGSGDRTGASRINLFTVQATLFGNFLLMMGTIELVSVAIYSIFSLLRRRRPRPASGNIAKGI